MVLGAASPALAQAGAFGVDAMFAPNARLGLAYYLTDGLSVRPWLGLGYAGGYGFYANVGAQLRYEFAAGSTLSPYLSGSAQYAYSDTATMAEPGSPGTQVAVVGSGGQFGAGAGLRYRLADTMALFAEGGVLYATYPIGALRPGWTTFDINQHARGQVVLGFSYLFH
jgi:hypothetical protein